MSRLSTKTAMGGIVVLTLFYYGVAWAVLRCPHQEGQSDQETAVYVAASCVVFAGDRAEIHCAGPNYHMEALAVSAYSSDHPRLARHFVGHVEAFPGLTNGVQGQFGNVWQRALANQGPLSTAIQPPRYISLSVLRF